MFRRIAATILLVWAIGFIVFAVTLPQPIAGGKADAVIVVTGGTGRIDRAMALVRNGVAPRVLVSGVDREVRPAEFAAEYDVPARLMRCCVTLGYSAYDTRSNAIEAARWLEEHRARTVRLVTSDWHMRRAALEFGRELPADIAVQRDAVPSKPSLRILFLEYHKLLARYVLRLWNR